MKLKETFTREELDLIALISIFIKDTPDTYEGDSAYWGNIEVDFKNKVINYNTEDNFNTKLYYTIAGIAERNNFKFEEVWS